MDTWLFVECTTITIILYLLRDVIGIGCELLSKRVYRLLKLFIIYGCKEVGDTRIWVKGLKLEFFFFFKEKKCRSDICRKNSGVEM